MHEKESCSRQGSEEAIFTPAVFFQHGFLRYETTVREQSPDSIGTVPAGLQAESLLSHFQVLAFHLYIYLPLVCDQSFSILSSH